MNARAEVKAGAAMRPGRRRVITAGVVLVVIIAMALDTKVVKIGSQLSASPHAFSADDYAKTEFPKVQAAVEKRAVDAATLAAALAKNQAAATKQYGIPGGTGPEFSVKFTGVVGAGEYGIYRVKVPDVPDDLVIRMQTGPAINGTDIRDATGTIKFGQFTNQIDYQNAAAALNTGMKAQVLSKIDHSKLVGKTVQVVGVFQLINPKGWLITPVKLSVQ